MGIIDGGIVMKAAIFLLSLAIAAHAGILDSAGIWQLDGNFSGSSPGTTALNASSLTPGVDYSFATAGGYHFLQTQPFAPSSKRLTITNPIGPNGGPGSTKTNRWSVVMDVKFDAFQPYSGILQLDPAPANRIRHSNTDGADSGVNHDGQGNLSGLAWGANIGWINFGTGSNGAPRPLSDPNRPRLDLLTGEFSGYAHSANTGWIRLSGLRTTSIHFRDEDGDGLADAWEHEHFGNLTTANVTSDTDNDGTKDKEEYLADTDPHDSASRPRITHHSLQFYPNEGYNDWFVTFVSSPRRIYRVETSVDLGAAISWSDASGLFFGGAGPTTSRTVSVQPSPKNFLRVKSLLPLQP